MLTKVAYAFGVVFLLIGVLGFVPGVTPDGHLLGIFDVSPIHNVIHLLSGVAALVLASMGERMAQWYFRIFGIVYGLVTVIGIIQGTTVLGLIGVNLADNILHLAITLVALYEGFGTQVEAARA